ncbi:MAG: flagellar hook-associated protein FlgK [Firmicutes bacterium]|nr:flagellar hook-associated protein FlgK [Bacillota bacterium]
MTIFGSIESGRSALKAQLKGMAVSGQNVANANTPGYSRQRVEMAPLVPALAPGFSLIPGYGVEITTIARVRSEFYHAQAISSGSHHAYWEMRLEAFGGAEVIFMEPGENGLGGYLNDFFDIWQELSSSPESAAVRTSLREQAVSFTDAVRNIHLRLTDLQIEMKNELGRRVEELNQLAAEAAELNEQIIYAGALGEKPNALLDRLDLVLEQLSGLVDISVYRKESGTVEILAGGRLLVQERQHYALALQEGDGGPKLVSSRGVPLELLSGRVKGLLEGINQVIPRLQRELNDQVTCLVEELNELHRRGYGLDGESGRDFFAPIDDGAVPAALQFSLNRAILDDVTLIAAATSPGEPGNGENSLSIARLRSEKIMDGGSISLMDSYRGMISGLGVEGRESERMAGAFREAAAQLWARHESVTGVNLDEEALNMIQFGHAWQAAANFIGHLDRMLETLFREL